MLFLLAAGLTLVFGIMDMINLAHGSLYMVGAFLAAWLVALTGSFVLGVLGAIAITAAFGMALETTLLRTLYARDHLSQVLATFALILILNDGVKMVFGTDLPLSAPDALSGPVQLLPGLSYPAYRLLILAVGLGAPARADEATAKSLLKAMSDYLAAQTAISFGYDTNLEVVTKDHQKLLLASSGTMDLARPDKFRGSRHCGFANVEMVFDGKTLTLLGKDANLYTQVDVPGTLDHLVDELRDTHHRPVPGADLLLSHVYDELMGDVVTFYRSYTVGVRS